LLAIIDSATTGLLGLALDAAAMRQMALAHNIANINTPDYRRVNVAFEQHVSAMLETGVPDLAEPTTRAALRPHFQLAPAGAEARVEIDAEVTALSENTLHHQVLLKMLNKHMAIMSMAVNEGKR